MPPQKQPERRPPPEPAREPEAGPPAPAVPAPQAPPAGGGGSPAGLARRIDGALAALALMSPNETQVAAIRKDVADLIRALERKGGRGDA